jgi:lipopolysaccharide transport system permease protein
MSETSIEVTKPQTALETLVLKPSKGWVSLQLGDLWRYRELIFFLTWKDVLVRYKQTLLGVAWAIIQPVLQMVVFNFLFGSIAEIPTGDIPRPVFTFAALLPWNLFAKALGDASRSLVSSASMITKVYFPRLVIPMASTLSGLVDFAVAFLILIGMMFYYNVPLTGQIWAVPLLILLTLVAALGVGLWFSAWNLHYRDVRYLLPFLTQFWLLATPTAYPLSEIPAEWQVLYSINPMVGVVEGFRWALADGPPVDPVVMIMSISISALMLITGLFYFKRMERTFADKV